MFDYLIKNASIVDGTGIEPFTGNIAIKDGVIAGIGEIDGEASEVIDAQGAFASPGWVDVHTHFDGQVSWDDTLDPSFSHGVTSVVMGNCGVGFAPVHPGGEQRMIDLMEGVEDIPGTALYEGIEWGQWETFPEYLDYLSKREFSMDIGTQVPHSAVRNYVMGERALVHEDATSDDLDSMSDIVKEAISAGALGFSTSRTAGHRSVQGDPIPGTYAESEELLSIARAIKSAGKGIFQAVPAGVVGDLVEEKYTTEEEVELFTKIAAESQSAVTFTLAQNNVRPDQWRNCMEIVEQAKASGLEVTPQITTRPIGFVTSLKSYHMFQRRETFLRLTKLPFEEMFLEMKKPEIKKAILTDKDIDPELPGTMASINGLLGMAAPAMFPIDYPIDYEPEASKNLGTLAASLGKDMDDFMYDFLLEDEGNRFAILLGANFIDGNFDVMHEMILHPDTTIGLSDAGAHVNLIFDAVNPTYQLIHWVRDRKRGPKLPIELIVQKQTLTNANLFGLKDRGSLEVGKRADINLFDLKRLKLGKLQVAHDLPAGGNRILQSAEGYLNTFVAGVKTRENDSDTGARPGRLIRS
ncbi:MAG: amidohydrolase family protein [SAR86 cluster bacterium]|jgi:N-acyl-D-amino-acid deacylase|nr:amidohydrolase family protein [SAR86 cluster bacterium]